MAPRASGGGSQCLERERETRYREVSSATEGQKLQLEAVSQTTHLQGHLSRTVNIYMYMDLNNKHCLNKQASISSLSSLPHMYDLLFNILSIGVLQ